MPDKKIFSFSSLPLKDYALSFGLVSIPEVNVKQAEANTMTKLQKLRQKIKEKKEAKAGVQTLTEEVGDLFKIKDVVPDLYAEEEEEEPVRKVDHSRLKIQFSEGNDDISNRLIQKARGSQLESIQLEKQRQKMKKIKIKQMERQQNYEYIEESD